MEVANLQRMGDELSLVNPTTFHSDDNPIDPPNADLTAPTSILETKTEAAQITNRNHSGSESQSHLSL